MFIEYILGANYWAGRFLYGGSFTRGGGGGRVGRHKTLRQETNTDFLRFYIMKFELRYN